MPTKTERHELEVQKAAARGAREALEGMEILALARSGSNFNEAVQSGSYASGGDYEQYELIGDEIGLYNVAP